MEGGEEEMKMEVMGQELREAVTNIHFGSLELKLSAMGVIQRAAAAQEGLRVSKCLIGLGVVPQLLAMVNSSHSPPYHISSLKALVQLCNSNSSGKIAILEGGALSKLSNLYSHQTSSSLETNELIALLLLKLSTLDLNKPIIAASPALPILVSMLSNSKTVSASAKTASISALLNLSTCFENLNLLIRFSTVQSVFDMLQDSEKSARFKCLCILSAFLLIEQGRKVLEKCMESRPEILVGVLAKEEEPRCQERAGLIIMVLVHYSMKVRWVLRALDGFMLVVVEMGLVGKSSVLRNRCLRIIRNLKEDAKGFCRKGGFIH